LGGTVDTVLNRLSAGILQLNAGAVAGNTGTLNLGELQLIGGTPAASTSQLLCTTAPYTAGTGSTNSPVAYLDSGTVEPTTWSTAGTVLGMNAPSGFTGNFLDCHVNGAGSVFNVSSTGAISAINLGNVLRVTTANVPVPGLAMLTNCCIQWTGNTVSPGDTMITRVSAGTVQIGTTAANSLGSLKASQLIGGSAIPTIAAGTGAGTTPTIALATGSSNLAGQISVTVGTAPAGANAAIVTATLGGAYAFTNPPFVVLTPANPAAAALSGSGGTQIYVTSTTTTFTLNSGANALTAAAQYVFNYSIIGS
jgi:hypothetical protein